MRKICAFIQQIDNRPNFAVEYSCSMSSFRPSVAYKPANVALESLHHNKFRNLWSERQLPKTISEEESSSSRPSHSFDFDKLFASKKISSSPWTWPGRFG